MLNECYPALFMNASAAIADSLLRRYQVGGHKPLRRELIDAAGQAKLGMAGVLAAQSLDILFQVCLRPSRLCLSEDTAASPTRRRPQTWRSLFFAPWTSPGDCAISRRTVMNNAG
jgi:hypothetical protein